MATIRDTCPTCHATHEYSPTLAGKFTKCLSCGSRFYIHVPEDENVREELTQRSDWLSSLAKRDHKEERAWNSEFDRMLSRVDFKLNLVITAVALLAVGNIAAVVLLMTHVR